MSTINATLQARLSADLKKAQDEHDLMTLVLSAATAQNVSVTTVYPHAYCGEATLDIVVEPGQLVPLLKAFAPLEQVLVEDSCNSVKPKQALRTQEKEYSNVFPVFPITWSSGKGSAEATHKWFTTIEGKTVAIAASLKGSAKDEFSAILAKNDVEVDSYSYSTGHTSFAALKVMMKPRETLLSAWLMRWEAFAEEVYANNGRTDSQNALSCRILAALQNAFQNAYYRYGSKTAEQCSAERHAEIKGLARYGDSLGTTEMVAKVEQFLQDMEATLPEALNEYAADCKRVDDAIVSMCEKVGLPPNRNMRTAGLNARETQRLIEYVYQATGIQISTTNFGYHNKVDRGTMEYVLSSSYAPKSRLLDVRGFFAARHELSLTAPGRKNYLKAQNLPVVLPTVVLE